MYELRRPAGWLRVSHAEALRLMRSTSSNPRRSLEDLRARPFAQLPTSDGLLRYRRADQ